MRGYQLFADHSHVAVEWRIAGFRVRMGLMLWALGCGVAAAALFAVNIIAGAVTLVLGIATVLFFAAYIYRNDKNLVLSEGTMLSLLRSGTKHRYRTNEIEED